MTRLLLVVLALSLSVSAQMWPMPGPGSPAAAAPPAGCTSGSCSDSFTGTAGTALATHDSNWTSLPTYVVTNIKLSGSGTAYATAWASGGGYYNASSSDTSQMVVKAQASATLVQKFVTVRAGASSKGYAASFNSLSGGNYTQVIVAKDGGFLATPASGSWSAASDHTLKIVASGTSSVTLTIYVDGTSVGTATDSTSPLPAGKPGFYIAAGSSGTATDNAIASWQDH